MERKENSVVEVLREAHTALLADLRDLEQAVHPSSGNGLEELRTRLAATLAHITKHFRFEEQNGYMDVVRKREPRLDRKIDHLAKEHGQLAGALEAIIQKAGAATSLGDSLRTDIWEWIKHVCQHESSENELVEDAFNLDIGAEDWRDQWRGGGNA